MSSVEAEEQVTDADLLHAVARGDEQALARLYDRYHRILFGIVLRISNGRTEAEDVLQEVFIQVWQRAGDFDVERGRAFTWLVTMARSRAIDRLRQTTSRERVVSEAARATPLLPVDVFAGERVSEQGDRVRRALAELPEDQCRALCLAYFDGLTQTEIAARLDVPLGTIKTRVRSGLSKLRELLQDE